MGQPLFVAHLGVVELHGVVGGQRHTQALLQELPERVLGVLQEQAVVAQGGHGDGNLRQVVEILQNWTLRGERERASAEITSDQDTPVFVVD